MSGRSAPRAWADPWDFFSSDSMEVIVQDDAPEFEVSPLLGPDGRPLIHHRPRQPMGFDLRPRKDSDAQ